jgi:hypothetical protein
LRLVLEGLAEAPPNDSAQPKVSAANDKTENVAFLPPPDFRSMLRNEYDLKFALSACTKLNEVLGCHAELAEASLPLR